VIRDNSLHFFLAILKYTRSKDNPTGVTQMDQAGMFCSKRIGGTPKIQPSGTTEMDQAPQTRPQEPISSPNLERKCIRMNMPQTSRLSAPTLLAWK
jgi:hypothetical protein